MNDVQNMHSLQEVRIIQRNLVYVIGIAPALANENELSSDSLFGKYGEIRKVILNCSPTLVEKVHSCCAYFFFFILILIDRYITYTSSEDALSCIIAMDGVTLQGSQIRASFGTTKYCNYFLRGMRCTNDDCMYLHELADPEDCFTKKEMQTRQAEFYERTHPTQQKRANEEMHVVHSYTQYPSSQSHSETTSFSTDKSESSSLSSSHTHNQPSQLQQSFPTIFGDILDNTFQFYSPSISNLFPSPPFQCCNVPSVEAHFSISEIPNLSVDESIPSVSSFSSTSIDVGFLFQAEEYVWRRRKMSDPNGDGRLLFDE